MLMPVAAVCPGPTNAAIDVVVVHGPADTGADLSLAQISEMASRTGRGGKHAPVGFYVGSFGYTVRVDVSRRDNAECPGPVHVTVTLALTDRHIQIAKEWAANPCTFAAARDHYLRHAAADDAVVSQFARALEAASRQVPLPPPTRDPASAEEDRRAVERAMAAMVDRGLESLGRARADARDSVDTPDEVRKLSDACASGR
jgi:hypothetical protein